MVKDRKGVEIKVGARECPVDFLVMPYFRVILIKNQNEGCWHICSNPSWSFASEALSTVLFNAANNYVEYMNCGVRHRMIRFSDLKLYIPGVQDFKSECALDPRLA
jgi:hypothetical protein